MPITLVLRLNETGDSMMPVPDISLNRLQQIHWKIDDGRIESFRIVQKNSRPDDPFIGNVNTEFKTKHFNTARWSKQTEDWYYKIEWKSQNSNTIHELDPKIAVNPGVDSGIYLAAVGVFILIIPLLLKKRFFNRN